MQSPFKILPSAFCDFYDTALAVKGKRPQGSFSTSCMGCVLDQGYEDVLEESGSTSSSIRKISVNILKHGDGGWLLNFHPQIGDIIRFESGEEFAVMNVDVLHEDEYILEARKK